MDSPISSRSSADSLARIESESLGKRVLVGSSDFGALRTEGGIFVDKSLFVKEFIESCSSYNVVLRPRRFGKSINLSMLGYFFSRYKKNGRDLFRGLGITEYQDICTTHMGKYPVIELSMKQCVGKTWPMMKRSIARMMFRALTFFGDEAINDIPGARMLVDCVMKDFTNGCSISDDGLWEMLGYLIRVLCRRDNSQVILLIDEYDAPLNVVFKDENDNQMRLDFFSNFYSFALKDNPSLWRACLVGITEIRGAGIFSGLNNLQTYSLNDEGFAEFFGFSEVEVIKVLTSPAVGMQEKNAHENWSKSGGIRDWYHGYRIEKFLLINPWSFMCCISRGLKLRSYWARTATVDSLMDFMAERPSLAHQVIEHARLLLSAELKDNISRNGRVVVGNLQSALNVRCNNTWSDTQALHFLCLAGYLTYEEKDEDTGEVWIPNYELKGEWGRVVGEFSEISSSHKISEYYGSIKKALLDFDTDAIHKHLVEIISNLSNREKYHEYAYQIMIAGVLFAFNREPNTRAMSEVGAGKGFADLVVVFENERRAVIIEIKRAKSIAALAHEAEVGLQQIKDRNYVSVTHSGHEILMIGCAIFGNSLIELKSEVLRKVDPGRITLNSSKSSVTKRQSVDNLSNSLVSPREKRFHGGTKNHLS